MACHYSEHNPIAVQFLTSDGATLRVTELVSSVKVNPFIRVNLSRDIHCYLLTSTSSGSDKHSLDCVQRQSTFQASSSATDTTIGPTSMSLVQSRSTNSPARLRRCDHRRVEFSQGHARFYKSFFCKFKKTIRGLTIFNLKKINDLINFLFEDSFPHIMAQQQFFLRDKQ